MAITAFLDGDTQPLRFYLEKGYRIDGNLAGLIIDVMRPDADPVRMEMKRNGQDRRAWSVRCAAYENELTLGIEAVNRTRVLPRGQSDVEIEAIAAARGVSKSTVYKAKRLVELQLRHDQGGAPYINSVRLEHELKGVVSEG